MKAPSQLAGVHHSASIAEMRRPNQSEGVLRTAAATPFHFGITASKGRQSPLGSGGGPGLGCWPVFNCYPCTRCIPFTSICFSSTCCDFEVECDFGLGRA
jgi:hypothetical protein